MIRELVVNAMRSHPENRSAFEAHRAAGLDVRLYSQESNQALKCWVIVLEGRLGVR